MADLVSLCTLFGPIWSLSKIIYRGVIFRKYSVGQKLRCWRYGRRQSYTKIAPPPKGPTHLLTDSPGWPSTFFLPTLPSYYSATRSVGAQLLSGGPPGVLTSCFAPFRCSSRMTQCLKIPQSLKHPISKSGDEKYCNKLWRNSVDHVWWIQ